MPSGQVSIWIPLGVAVLGIVGVVIGNVVNNRSQNKRLLIQALDDERKTLHADKMRIFASFIEVFHEWAEVLHHAVDKLISEDEPPSSDVAAQLKHLGERIRPRAAQLYLVASRDLRDKCDGIMWLYRDTITDLCADAPSVTSVGKVTAEDVPLDAYYELLSHMRAELSIDPKSAAAQWDNYG
ncbi:hypothetical protein DMA12_46220 [Amycolatopsis balhimycina DSM 5908]|uniref:Uncharacterized protein n=1 Tax=Amycolatopsis balhimycina DSM 5908 TaxID=1081091 RepID=A0A428VVU8_AMYBA|nr:hypothetical protein [Amycolatopsis balhimycina]RSM34956.1 hypothetical protein DMA12_46220 [Amycolatopsis balhimycina DSM 5908]